MHVTIQGGTHAGWRAVKERPPWTHDCSAARHVLTLPGHVYSCLCGARRP